MGANGGGIMNDGAYSGTANLTITSSTVTGNASDGLSNYSGGNGGGIDNYGYSGAATVTMNLNSTISGNTGAGRRGRYL